MPKISFVPLILFAVVVVFLGIGLGLDPGKVPSPFLNKPAPDFSLPEVTDNSQVVSNKDYAGKVWILNVWASWCGPCQQEHPLFNELAAKDIISIIGLNYKDTTDDAIAWLQALGNPYTAIASDISGDIGVEYGVYGVPETFVIDQDGIVRLKHIGPVTKETMDSEILPLIAALGN